MRGHYASQKTSVTKSGRQWKCKTELTPIFWSKDNPIDTEVLELLKAADKNLPKSACRDLVEITERTAKGKATVKACLTVPSMSEFIEKLNRSCGRSF